MPPKHVKASGSRERPSALHVQSAATVSKSPWVDASRWVIRGSRLLRTFFWTDEALERISRVGLVRAKAAPLQALGDHTR